MKLDITLTESQDLLLRRIRAYGSYIPGFPESELYDAEELHNLGLIHWGYVKEPATISARGRAVLISLYG